MYSKKHYTFDSSAGRDSARPTYTSDIGPKESNVDRENYQTKEDSRQVSENITKSVITRSVVDKRSSSAYKTREDSKASKTSELERISGRDPSRFAISSSYDMEEKENKAPISSFYSSYSKDEDLSDVGKFDQPTHNMQNGISSFYLSGVGAGSDRRNVDQRTKSDHGNKDSTSTSGYKPSSSGLYTTQGERWNVRDKTDSSGSLRRERSLEGDAKTKDPGKDSARAIDDPRKITLDDISILRRALERKQVSNSLERERLTKPVSGDGGSDPSNPTSKVYSSNHGEKDTPQGTANQYPKIRSSVTTTYDVDYMRNAKTGNDDVFNRINKFEIAPERLGRSSRSTDLDELPETTRIRSRSSESLDRKRRSKLGIYQELPGRKEFLSYSRSLSNVAGSRPGEDKRYTRDDRRSGSLDRYASSMSYNREDDRDRRASLLRSRSRSSEDLRSVDKDKENEMSPGHRSSYLPRHRSIERVDRFGRDVTNRRDFGRREISPSSRDKLREDIARLKAEAEMRRVTKRGDIKLYSFSREPTVSRDTTREIGPSSHYKLREDIARLKYKTEAGETKRDDVKLYSFSREPSVQDKLKEDIAKLKAETLTREHVKPYIPPPTSRPEPENISSRWKSREPSVHDKLKESIAKLKAETRHFPSQPSGGSGVTTEMIIPGREMQDKGHVRQSGLARTSIERYHVSKRDGIVFKDELKSEETKQFGKDDGRRDYPTHKHDTMRMDDKPTGATTDEGFPESSREYYRPTRDEDVSFPRRPSEGPTSTYFSRTRPDDSSSWPRADNRSLTERNDSSVFPGNMWDDPKRTSWEGRTESTQGYASKKVYRADSTVSISSTKDSEGGPNNVTGFFHGSVSKEDHSAFFSKQKGDKEDGYPVSTRVSDSVRRPGETIPDHLRRPFGAIPEHVSQPVESVPDSISEPDDVPEPVRRPEGTIPVSVRRTEEAIPLPYTGYEIVSPRQEDSISSPRESKDKSKQTDKGDREVRSEKVHSTREFVTRKTIKDSVISRESSKDDVSRLPSKVDTPRRFSERSEPPPRRRSTREEIIISEESKVPHHREFTAHTWSEYKDSKPSGMSELRKKIEQLKSKVESLDDTRARMRLERYVDEHSERKPDVEIKDPVNIKRYEPSGHRPDMVDGADRHLKREGIDTTFESFSRQISRQKTQEDTIRRISSIREDELRAAPQTPEVCDGFPDEAFPKEPAVIKPMRDAETMTAPEVQELVGSDKIQRQDSTIRGIVEEPERLEELRGVPIDHIDRTPQIQEVGTGQVRDTGVTTVQIDEQQQIVSPKKDTQGWWNAFTAEDVDRLLDLGNRSPYAKKPYTAEDVDRMFHIGPMRRRSLRRGAYERRQGAQSFRRYQRHPTEDLVDVHVRVRGRQEKRSRPHCIIAQAAPEEKAIVLRDTKESADPFISKIKVDDVYGADAVRVENGVVKIKVGDLFSKGRRAWARILQQQNRIVESDGTVTIPVSQDHYEDGVYQTNYYQQQAQDGTMRLPIKFKIQEQDKAKSNRLRVIREIKRAGSMRRKRRGRGYIVGARYYSGNLMLTSAEGYQSKGSQREIVLRKPQDSSKVTTSNEIVLRSSSHPITFPMQTVQRIHEGHKITRQADSCRNEDGKMVITVHAVPPQPQKFNLKQVGENMTRASDMLTSRSYHGSAPDHRGVSNTSGSYYITSTSGRGGGGGSGHREYVTTSGSGRQGNQGTSYFVTDPSDSFDRRLARSGSHGVTRVYNTHQVSSTPTIIPYEDEGYPSRRGPQSDSFIRDPSSFYGFYDAPGARIVTSDPRLNARTGYGEKFNLRDHGGISSVQYVNGARQGSRIINEKVIPNGRYRYGSSWNSKQQDRLNGRSMAWAVEEVRPDF